MKNLNSQQKDQLLIKKLEKDCTSLQNSVNSLTREWASKEKTPIPPKQTYKFVNLTFIMYDTYSLLFSSQNRFYEESNEKTHLLETDWKQLNLVEQNLDTQDSLIAEREEGIDEIHGKMVEVNEIFTDLNTIVVEQAPLVG